MKSGRKMKNVCFSCSTPSAPSLFRSLETTKAERVRKGVVARVPEVKRKSLQCGGQVFRRVHKNRSQSRLLCEHPQTMGLLPAVVVVVEGVEGGAGGGGERQAQPEPDTGSSQSDTKQSAELRHFPSTCLQKDYLRCH